MGNWNYSERLGLGWRVEKNLSEEVRVISKRNPEREGLQWEGGGRGINILKEGTQPKETFTFSPKTSEQREAWWRRA